MPIVVRVSDSRNIVNPPSRFTCNATDSLERIAHELSELAESDDVTHKACGTLLGIVNRMHSLEVKQ